MAVIPFASHTAPRSTTSRTGSATTVSAITFAGASPVITLASDGTVALSGDNQDVFSLPFNAVVESIYMTVSTRVDYTFPQGLTVYPFMQLYVAAPSINTFTPIPTTKLIVNTGYSGATPSHTTRAASLRQIGLTLIAGIRILIGGHMEIAGSGTLNRDYNFYFTGGISLREV
jgi:hypothetical protein